MGYQISFSGAGYPEIAWLLHGAEQPFNENGVGRLAPAADAPTNAGGTPAGASDSGPQLPVIDADSTLLICKTKHPIRPDDCVKVALVTSPEVKNIEHGGHDSVFISAGLLIAVLVGFFLGRLARR